MSGVNGTAEARRPLSWEQFFKICDLCVSAVS
jgi:hypothetical protein